MKPQYVDYHCHLDLFPDPKAAIEAANSAGIHTLTVTTTPKAWPRNCELTRNTPFVIPALGMHPQLVETRASEITVWEKYLAETHFVGEVGLDASPRYYRSLELQAKLFERILKQCAKAGGKTLSIHSVRTSKMVLDMLKEHLPPDRGSPILHWFTGTKAELTRAIAQGCYFSINGKMVETAKGRELIEMMPMNRILTETDAPFTQCGNRPCTPADTAVTVASIALLKGESILDCASYIVNNMEKLLERVGVD